jgi:hypothetical protein
VCAAAYVLRFASVLKNLKLLRPPENFKKSTVIDGNESRRTFVFSEGRSATEQANRINRFPQLVRIRQ